MPTKMHPDLSHLSSAEQQVIIDSYYAGVPPKKLIEKYQLDCIPARFCSTFPPEIMEKQCPECGVALAREYRAKNKQFSEPHAAKCPDCGHIDSSQCKCKHCLAKREAHQNEIQQRNSSFCKNGWSQQRQLLAPEELTITEAVYLLALIHTSKWKQGSILYPLEDSNLKLAPNTYLTQQILDFLQQQEFIVPDPSSDPNSFEYFNGYPSGIFEEKINWKFNITNIIELSEKTERFASSKNWPERWLNGIEELTNLLAVSECINSFFHILHKNAIKYNGKISPVDMIKKFLKNYSISQVTQLMEVGLRNHSEYKKKNSYYDVSTPDNLINTCVKYEELSRNNDWQLNGSHEYRSCKRSGISHVLFDIFLSVGIRGYYMPLKDPDSRIYTNIDAKFR